MKNRIVNVVVLLFAAVAFSSCATGSGRKNKSSNKTKIVQTGDNSIANVTNVTKQSQVFVTPAITTRGPAPAPVTSRRPSMTRECRTCGTHYKGSHRCQRQSRGLRTPSGPGIEPLPGGGYRVHHGRNGTPPPAARGFHQGSTVIW